jgi:hypothetical protein
MFPIRVALGIKNVCFVYIFKYMIKVYLNSEICINICFINKPDESEIYTIRKRIDLFPNSLGVLAPTGH